MVGAIALIGVTAYSYGVVSYKYDLFPVPEIRRTKNALLKDTVDTVGFDDPRGRVKVDCAAVGGAAVLLAFGQSNSANHGETPYTPREEVYNFNFLDGHCYRANDPLLGATGSGGSVWSRLGDRLVAAGHFERVLIVPFGVNASEVKRWAPGGDLHRRIISAVQGLREHGLEPTHLLWHQGEADAVLATPAEAYSESFGNMLESIRSLGVGAPLFMAIASMCHNSGSDTIRNTQRAIIAAKESVYRGAESDTLDRMAWRYDGCHFSDQGLWLHAQLWYDALTSPSD